MIYSYTNTDTHHQEEADMSIEQVIDYFVTEARISRLSQISQTINDAITTTTSGPCR